MPVCNHAGIREVEMAKVLMVDDDREFLESCATVLQAQGHTVVLAENSDEGKAKAVSDQPDIIFLDIMMDQPDDGIALAHALRKQGVSTPIVMLSAVSKVTGQQYGKCDQDVLPCEDFLEKPVSPQSLIKKIETVLQG
ncbi:MAG: response regulator [Candidatus Omnitrophica bacterium]|nr:response regulator [Candidatus Omnitrophota bacterium]